ncbi:trypsin delta-like isoform X2 [Periplaneta americana]|uniref:trypsin delta-like isoform X2 n=1 Tax=Periplaneta americana TaxID=6978 RepID=UPI0037E98531
MKLFLAVLSTLLLGCLAKPKIEGILIDLARNVRIVNGQPAEDGEYPFQVSLQNYGSHYCGATVLNNEFLLTAAHCIYGGNIDSYTVRAGTNNYNSGGSVHQVVEWVYHQEYQNQAYWYNDVAVVRVDPPLTYSSKVQPTKLPAAGEEPAGGAASVAIGWGSGCYGCSGIADLQEVNLRIYSYSECLDIYGDGPTADMVCSGIPEEGKGVCSGDSGGALLVDGVQVGITSWTRMPCASYPAVWTKVSHYRDWIKEQSGV